MATEQQSPGRDDGQDAKIGLDRDDEDHDFVDTSKIDFDPDDGLYSGTAVDGTSKIPGPHQDGETGEVDLDEVKAQTEQQQSDQAQPADRA
jgi:hypothetical protein